MKRTYLTTPIYYVNGVPHVGTATTTLLADATARYRRLLGEDAYFLTGTDEHAQKVADAAAAHGTTPQAFVDTVSQSFVRTWDFLECRYDDFIRTSEPRHRNVVREIFRRLRDRGDIYLGVYEGWYSVADETFFRDTDVDENGIVKETGAKVERIREDVHYFRLSAYGDALRNHILAHPDFLQPETRRNEVLAFIDAGLRDIAISRRNAGWGIEVPDDPGKVIYVWFDALINYLSATGWPTDPAWESLWPCDAHLMAKEIFTRFHATLWPAMLMALDVPLPRHVVGHGWWVVRDESGMLGKASKSKGNIPTPQDVVAQLMEWGGGDEAICRDALRYYLLRDIRFTDDSEFSLAMLVSRTNSELGNDLGNILNRVLKAGYHDGVVPSPSALDPGLAKVAAETVATYQSALERYDWGQALQAVNQLLSHVNKYLGETAPWKAAKAGDTRVVSDAVYNALEGLRLGAYLLAPAMPEVARRIAAQLGLSTLGGPGSWSEATRFGHLVPGTRTGEAEVLFPRIVPSAPAQTSPSPAKAKDSAPMSVPENSVPADDTITIDDFLKVQLRVADIVTAEKVENADRLLKLGLRIGDEERTIVSGIATAYTPESLVGKQIVVVFNLAPRKMRGIESRGMLLAATDAEGNAILLHPDKPAVSGSEVR
ncbi:MAG: methionine--tRNA ligase [Armatimonadota bacterium]